MGMINKPDIIWTIEQAGIELKRNKALCPFHNERTPSFVVNQSKQTFHCFGCGEHGDVITFIQKFYNVSFKDACKHLNLQKPLRIDSGQQKKRTLVNNFRSWETTFKTELTDLFRVFHEITRALQTWDEVEAYAEDFHWMPIVEWYLDILTNGTDEEKYNLFKRTR